MRTHHAVLAVVLGTLSLALSVSTATAGRLSTSSQSFQFVWTPITYASEEEGGIQVRCNLTLRGSFHYRSIVKTNGSLIGYVTSATFGHPCSGSGEMWSLNGVETPNGLGISTNTLPWHTRFGGFAGTLPNISSINLEVVAPKFVIAVLGLLCLYTTGTARYIASREAGGNITGLRSEERTNLPKQSGSVLCPGALHFIGTGAVTNGSGARIRITLI